MKELTPELIQELTLEFENSVTDVLTAKTRRALLEFQPRSLIIAGGVIANKHLRRAFEKLIGAYPDVTLLIPTPELSTDNAIMIGIAGFIQYKSKAGAPPWDGSTGLVADGRLRL